MIRLEDKVIIDADFQKLKDWFLYFDTEFLRWSPYHEQFRLLSGGLEAGDEIGFRESVEGIVFDVVGTIRKKEIGEDGFSLVFSTNSKMARITFEGRKLGNKCEFYHVEEFGLEGGFLSKFINFVVFQVIYKKKCNWDVVKRDMVLDSKYLKEIIEEGKYPEEEI